MDDYGERLGQGSVRFRRTLPGPIDRVWAYLTESDKRAKWLAAGETELKKGGRVTLAFDHRQLSPLPDEKPPAKYADMPEQVTFTGVVTRCEPPRLLAYTWVGEDEASEVCYELEETGDRVVLTLTHTKLGSRSDEVGVLGGWHAHLDILEDVLAGREPAPFWRRFKPLDAHYDDTVPPAG